MSLINDALKHAKESQPKDTTDTGIPPLRLAESHRQSGGPGLLLPSVIGVVMVLLVAVLWFWLRADNGAVAVRARVQPLPVASVPKSAAPEPAPVVATTVPVPVSSDATRTETISTNTTTTPASELATDAVATVEPPKPAAAAFTLQGIFYRAKNPSAIINGKTVYVGDHINGGRVVAIDLESATLVTATGQTNVLELIH